MAALKALKYYLFASSSIGAIHHSIESYEKERIRLIDAKMPTSDKVLCYMTSIVGGAMLGIVKGVIFPATFTYDLYLKHYDKND